MIPDVFRPSTSHDVRSLSRPYRMVSLSFLSVCLAMMSSNEPVPKKAKIEPKRKPTLRSISSSLSDQSLKIDLTERALAMEQRAKHGQPLTDSELDDIVYSVQNISPDEIDETELRAILRDVAHLSHRDWAVTGHNAERLGNVLLKDGVSESARQLLERCLEEGNWDAAAAHATSRPSSYQPWAVLVTGVNGIRKTTSMYQEWFPQLLQEALVAPQGENLSALDSGSLPSGRNSFFRQLDHMIATLCNEDFALLYMLTAELLPDDGTAFSADVIKKYSDLKAAIFVRYRTLSELLGALLLREAQLLKSNCMMETSGKDVAMFTYVDHFFPRGYNKLALHFQINDLKLAMSSVDQRMIREIQTGMRAVQKQDVVSVIYSNAGGPYGSDVLPKIQEESDRVWNEQVLSGKVGQDWYKATIQINAHAGKPWTAQAVRPDGSLGTAFEFPRL